jgi:hypothetical protein
MKVARLIATSNKIIALLGALPGWYRPGNLLNSAELCEVISGTIFFLSPSYFAPFTFPLSLG